MKNLLIKVLSELKKKRVILGTIVKSGKKIKIGKIKRMGLCYFIALLYKNDIISWKEKALLYDYMEENKPISCSSGSYWFEPGLVEPRVKWLEEQINIEAVKELIIRYETITLEEISDKFTNLMDHQGKIGSVTLSEIKISLTGFGTLDTCTVCQTVEKIKFDTFCHRPVCTKCILNSSEIVAGCIIIDQETKSYQKLEKADTPRKLYYAYNQRAIFLRKYLTQKNIKW